jgi:adenine-specific DNA-methyltransferase
LGRPRATCKHHGQAAWSAINSATNRPFGPPETGKIAVKVINHYGDEVLKVYEL